MNNELPIVIVEDEEKLAHILNDYCVDYGYKTLLFHNGREALDWLKSHQARMVLLDLMLPEVDGLTICKEYRKHSDGPVIMITAKVEEIDRLLGLELGADDYICKPFSPREVIARVKTVLRRVESSPTIVADGLTLNENTYTASYKKAQAELTAVEFRLLSTLYEQPGRIFARDSLMNSIYKDGRIVSDRTVDSHIKKLRKKLIGLGLSEDVIQSVYGVGYRYQKAQ